MLQTDEILSTVRMLHAEHLDVRAVTLALNLNDCATPNVDQMCKKVYHKIVSRARNLVDVCDEVGGKYGVPITNKRLAISPAATLLAGHNTSAALALAQALDEAGKYCRVDFVGGFSALVQKGVADGAKALIDSLPEVLNQTSCVCASINAASRKAGINMDAVKRLGEVIREIADADAKNNGFAAAKLVVFANIPEDNPFMAGAYMGAGEPEAAINIGVSGPGVVMSALQRRIASAKESGKKLTLSDLSEEIKIASFRVTRIGELIGREVAERLNTQFGVVDLSLAPTPAVGDSIGEILKTLGLAHVGAPGSTAAIAMLNDAVKKGGLFASGSVGGLSGAFIPVSEDSCLADDRRLLRRARHDPHPRRHASDDDRRRHGGRTRDRRHQQQDDRDPTRPLPRQEGGRVCDLRRALWRLARHAGAQRRRERRVRQLRRTHPRAAPVARKLTRSFRSSAYQNAPVDSPVLNEAATNGGVF